MDGADAIYGIEELADRAGVSRRTVRYYVQRGLLPAPTGVGRGKHYTEGHLARLVRIRELQEEGVALSDVAARLDGHEPRTSDAALLAQGLQQQSTWTRVALSRDVELMVRARRLDEARMRRLIDAVREVLGEPGEDER